MVPSLPFIVSAVFFGVAYARTAGVRGVARVGREGDEPRVGARGRDRGRRVRRLREGDVPLTETVCVYTAVPEQELLSNRLKTTDPETLPEAKTIFALSFGPRRGGE